MKIPFGNFRLINTKGLGTVPVHMSPSVIFFHLFKRSDVLGGTPNDYSQRRPRAALTMPGRLNEGTHNDWKTHQRAHTTAERLIRGAPLDVFGKGLASDGDREASGRRSPEQVDVVVIRGIGDIFGRGKLQIQLLAPPLRSGMGFRFRV